MAWPINAIIRTYAALSQVFSDDLNEIQNRIVDLHRPRLLPITQACIKEDAGGIGEWYFDTDAPETGWTCVVTNGVLVLPIEIPDGAELQAVYVKVKNDSTASMVADLYEINHNIEAATTAPAKGSSLATDSAAGSGAWDTLTLDLTDQEMVDYRQVIVEITAATASDFVAAVYALYQPITPTP